MEDIARRIPLKTFRNAAGRGCRALIGLLPAKLRGLEASPPRVGPGEIFWAWIGSVASIACIGLLEQHVLGPGGMPLLIGSFGASAVLTFGAIQSPLAQPRNLVGGHVLSALIGVTCRLLLGGSPCLAAAVAVATAIALMQITKTLHPPGGATALIAVIGGDAVYDLGYLYAVVPCLSGALIMLLTGCLVNNLSPQRRYPLFWW